MRMKHLSEILSSVSVTSFTATEDHTISHLTFDSREVQCGSCFFAVRGTASDGHDYIHRAVEAGAVAVVCEQLPEQLSERVSYIVVEDSRRAMASMAAAYYDNPSHELKLVGVTGTNGKTTVATLLCDLYRAMGYRAGLISTVVYRVAERELPSTHTTPDAIRLNAMLREMVDAGCDYCFMEVSSHAVVQERVGSLRFAGVAFTNLSHDHLDYHGTFAEYIKAKKRLFDGLPKQAFAVVNVDDRNGEVMVQNTRARVSRYSLRQMADYRCRVVEMLFDGMQLRIAGQELWVPMIGRFNAYNLLCIYAVAMELGSPSDEVLRTMSMLRSVSGRFEPLRSPTGVTAIVDYAHTPDALENVIQTINDIRTPDQRLIVVCGCGGDRDSTKRPEMGGIASREADVAILTSDNPRTEDPERILDQMMEGVEAGTQTLRIADRRQAIRTAVMMAAAGDIVLIAGKGHETYQIVGRERLHFDDRAEVAEAFAELKK